jgi:hypothetical protein
MISYMIDKIMSYTSVSDREKINRLLELDCNMYANLGSDSTKAEKLEVKKQSRAIYRAIKQLDESVGRSLLEDLPDSGYKYMEREPVYILDEIIRKTRATMRVTLGYVTKPYGDKIRLVNTNSHRIGKAIRLRCVGHKKRMVIVKNLIEHGIERIAVNRETVYFDTDDLKEKAFYIWS